MNIQRIAELSGVSVATVSRVINNKPNISPKTYAKVVKVMEQENYQPNALARGLSLNKAKMIGVVVDDIRNLYRANVVYSMENALSREGYSILIFNARPKGSALYSQLSQQHLDALVFVGSALGSPENKAFLEQNYREKPILMFNGQLDLPNAFSIICDEYAGLQLIADHLYRRGFRHPVYIDLPGLVASERKLKGFRDKLKELKIPFSDDRIVCATDNGFDAGQDAAAAILNRGLSFDSIVCAVDLLAMGAMHTLKRYGYEVPRDVAVTGFDNLIYGKLSSPFLTSVDGNADAMSQLAAEKIVAILNGAPYPDEPIYFAPTLFLGETT